MRDSGARLVATITGDRHHYARYEPEGGEGADAAPTRITAGGGGAYLSATHTLDEKLLLKTLPRKTGADSYEDLPPVAHRREQIYPLAGDSRRLSNGILKLAVLNPAFGRLLGALYVLLGVALLGRVDAIAQGGDGFPAYPLERGRRHGADRRHAAAAGRDLRRRRHRADVRGGEPKRLVSLARLLVALLHTAVHVLVGGRRDLGGAARSPPTTRRSCHG